MVLAALLAQLVALPTERSAALPAAGPRGTLPTFQNVLAVERYWLLHPQTVQRRGGGWRLMIRPNFVQYHMTATLYTLHRCSLRHGGKQRRWQLPGLLWPQLAWSDAAAGTALSLAREHWTARARLRGTSAGGHAWGFSPLEMSYVSGTTHLQTVGCNVRDYRVFEILRFFMKTPGWVMHGFRRYKLNVLMYSYL